MAMPRNTPFKPRQRRFLTPAMQVYVMRQQWPTLDHQQRGGKHIWIGEFQPDEDIKPRKACIEYTPVSGRVKVFLLDRQKDENFQHLHKDGSLCLYFPDDPIDQRWSPYRHIAETIVPWIATWILFNHFYKLTSRWHAPEIRHDTPAEKELPPNPQE
jgi:hypothetical protein